MFGLVDLSPVELCLRRKRPVQVFESKNLIHATEIRCGSAAFRPPFFPPVESFDMKQAQITPLQMFTIHHHLYRATRNSDLSLNDFAAHTSRLHT